MKKTLLKKILSAALAAAMGAMLLSGCGGSAGSGNADAGKKTDSAAV